MFTVDPALALIVRLLTACLLATAAGAKLIALEPFVGVVHNYRLLPTPLTRPVAYLIPPLELLIATTIMVLFSSVIPLAGAATLLLGFAVAMGINLMRGHAEIDCGCFIGFVRQRLSWVLVMRNLLLAAALLTIASASAANRLLVWFDVLTIAAGCASLLLVWAIAGRLFGIAPLTSLPDAG
ncbi:MAG: hypothetical protein JOZ58_17310 [Acetobacteraceae bacterium]|nr:hypothetical protein [Acetobacteraceae bacterium]